MLEEVSEMPRMVKKTIGGEGDIVGYIDKLFTLLFNIFLAEALLRGWRANQADKFRLTNSV